MALKLCGSPKAAGFVGLSAACQDALLNIFRRTDRDSLIGVIRFLFENLEELAEAVEGIEQTICEHLKDSGVQQYCLYPWSRNVCDDFWLSNFLAATAHRVAVDFLREVRRRTFYLTCFTPNIDYEWAKANLPRLADCLARQLCDGHHLDDPLEFERLAYALQRERAAIDDIGGSPVTPHAIDAELRAIAVLFGNPTCSVRQIAKEIGVHEKTPYKKNPNGTWKWDKFHKALGALKGERKNFARGIKDPKSGEFDAWEDSP